MNCSVPPAFMMSIYVPSAIRHKSAASMIAMSTPFFEPPLCFCGAVEGLAEGLTEGLGEALADGETVGEGLAEAELTVTVNVVIMPP